MPKSIKNMNRVKTICELYQSGKTLAQIGEIYHISKERVRQIVSEYIPKGEGGKSLSVKIRVLEKALADLDVKYRSLQIKYRKLYRSRYYATIRAVKKQEINSLTYKSIAEAIKIRNTPVTSEKGE